MSQHFYVVSFLESILNYTKITNHIYLTAVIIDHMRRVIHWASITW